MSCITSALQNIQVAGSHLWRLVLIPADITQVKMISVVASKCSFIQVKIQLAD